MSVKLYINCLIATERNTDYAPETVIHYKKYVLLAQNLYASSLYTTTTILLLCLRTNICICQVFFATCILSCTHSYQYFNSANKFNFVINGLLVRTAVTITKYTRTYIIPYQSTDIDK